MARRKPAGIPVWGWMAIVAGGIVAMGVGFVFVVLASKPLTSDSELLLLKDNPTELKGHTIRLFCYYDDWSGPLPVGGGVKTIFRVTVRSASIRFYVNVPTTDGPYPALTWGDPTYLVFRCNEGSTDHGNEVLTLTRR